MFSNLGFGGSGIPDALPKAIAELQGHANVRGQRSGSRHGDAGSGDGPGRSLSAQPWI